MTLDNSRLDNSPLHNSSRDNSGLHISALDNSARHNPIIDSVTDDTFADSVITASRGRTVLVEFWAEWCPPCRALSPILEQLAAEHPETLTVVKVNADDNPRIAGEYRALALPTMKVFLDGEVVKTIVGAKRKAALEADLVGLLG